MARIDGRLVLALTAASGGLLAQAPAEAAVDSAATAVTAVQADDDESQGTGTADLASREIVVTAQRRLERIQDVPFAITAVGQEEVLDRGAAELRDLQFSIPGLNIVSLNPGADRVLLRGIDPGSGTGLPIVGIYVDEVGVSVDQQQRDPPFPLVDIARVEVLRGPQGTTFGQGSVAGTIRYITQAPSLDQAGGYMLGNVYSQQNGDIGYRLNAALGLPVIEGELGVRMVGGYERYAGWIDATGAGGVEDANVTDRHFLRAQLLWQPTANSRVALLYQYLDQESDSSGLADIDNRLENSVAPALAPSSDTSHLVNLSVDLDIGGVTLTSATGYQRRRNLISGVITTPPIVINFDTVYEQVSQEIRLASADQEAPLSWVAGAWYRSFDSTIDRTATLAGAPFAGLALRGDDPVDSESRAVFGNLTWRPAARLEVSGGARYYWDDRASDGVTPAGPLPSRRASFDAFTPRLNVLYRWTDDISTYATAAKGFRSGGFNGGSGSSYGPESLWSYEVGTKGSLLGGRLFFELAGYYLDYSNRQSQGVVLINGVNFSETTNSGAASGVGIEAAISARLPARIGIDLTASYSRIRYDRTTLDTNAGEPFDYVPDFTASASVHQRIPIGTSIAYWRVDYQHGDPVSSIQRANVCSPATGVCVPGVTIENYRTRSQDIVNLRAGIEFGRWDLSADVYNLTNEDAETFLFSPVATFQQAVFIRPRSYGLTLRVRFD